MAEKVMEIYLAGGFKSDWQERVINSISEHLDHNNGLDVVTLAFLNPKTKGSRTSNQKGIQALNKIFENPKNYVN